MICGDCNGSGKYVGLHEKELCRECDGTGVVGESELEMAERKAVKKFGPEQIQEGLRPEYVCLNLTASFGNNTEEIREKIHYIFLRKGTPSAKGRWVDWEGKTHSSTKVIEYFGNFPHRYYALYRRMAPGNNVFELIAFQ
jgi:hypothetical protein